MKYVFILMLLINVNLYSQNIKNRFEVVKIPDSLKIKLALVEVNKNKLETAIDSSYMALYIFDVVDKKNLVLKNGVYSWKVMGPHFSNRLFIFYNNKVFIFKSKGKNSLVEVLEEYITSIGYLNIAKVDQISYLTAVSKYLKEELLSD